MIIPDSALNLFFDFSKPCPKEILNCQQLREQYIAEEKAIKLAKGKVCCGEKSALIRKYLKAIRNDILP